MFVLQYITVGKKNGSMPEWLMGVDCKSTGYAYAGSNPARPTTKQLNLLEKSNALVAQW